MNKYLIAGILTISLLPSVVNAQSLCIGLINKSNKTVEFSTMSDPGWIPIVKPGETTILSGDFMASCYNGCNVYIREPETNATIYINSVPKGTAITLDAYNQYHLDENAKIACPY